MKKISIASLIEKDYRINEAYKTLRTNLLFCGSAYKIIVLTSCDENEGKTTVTLELAKSLVETGKRVLVIDADMRKSVIQRKYLSNEEPLLGLSEYLSDQAELSDILAVADEEKLFIIPSGKYPPNPVELLGTPRFKALLESSRNSFDYILVDTPPLGLVIDAAVVAEFCDGAILILHAGKTSARLVRSVRAQLEKSQCTLLGGVFNNVQVGRNIYYKHYYKHYYRGYYHNKYYGDDNNPKQSKQEEEKE